MTDNTLQIRNSIAEFLIFTAQGGEQGIEVRFAGETAWLTQKMMAELFAVDVRTISEHLRNILNSGELQRASVIRKFRITAADGKREDYFGRLFEEIREIRLSERLFSQKVTNTSRSRAA